MIYRSWCGYCSREYSDKRWLQIKNEKEIVCLSCGKKSHIKDDPSDEYYFYLERCDNGRRKD